MKLPKRFWDYSILIVFVIVTNIGLASRYFDAGLKLDPDPALYYETAKTIAQGKTWVEHYGFDIGAIMAPGFSFLLAGILKIFGDNVAIIYYLNILLHIFSALFLFYLVYSLTNRLFAWFFSLWLLFYYQIWRMNFQVMMEISTIFFLALLIYFIYKYIKSKEISYLFIFSLTFGLLIFINNRFIFHLFVLMVGLGIYSYFKNTFKYSDLLLLGIVVFLVLLPWHIRQYIVYDKLVLFSPGRMEIIQTSVSTSESDKNIGADKIMSYEEYLKRFEATGGMTESRMVSIRKAFTVDKYNKMVTQFQRRYSRNISKYISRLISFWRIWQFDFSFSPGGDPRIVPPARPSANLFNIFFLTPMFIFFPVGLFYCIRKNQIFIQILCIFVLSHWLLHSIVHYISRYRIPLFPFIFIVAWYGLFELDKRILLKKRT